MKVLVTGAGALLGQGIIRSMKATLPDVEIVAVDPSPEAVGLYWVSRRHLVPMAKDPEFGNAIDAVIGEEQPDAVLVGTDVELPFFAANRERLERTFGTHVVVSSERVVAIADDKLLTYEFMRDHGFDPPESRPAESAHELVDLVGFPLIVKPRIGARSVGVHLVRDRAELDRALAEDPGAFVQEHVAGPDSEYTAGTITFEGSCTAEIVMRRDLRDGNTYRAYVDDSPDLAAQVRAMADALQAFGPANFQFRLDRGRARVFEINARFSGTTPLRTLAGFDEVAMVLDHVVHGTPVNQPSIEPVALLRHLGETVVPLQDLMQ